MKLKKISKFFPPGRARKKISSTTIAFLQGLLRLLCKYQKPTMQAQIGKLLMACALVRFVRSSETILHWCPCYFLRQGIPSAKYRRVLKVSTKVAADWKIQSVNQ